MIIIPQYIAHRGLSAHAPENTMAAFRLADERGYRMFECDVQLRDGNVAVIVHDDIAGFGPKKIAQLPTMLEVLEWMLTNEISMNLELKGVQTYLVAEVVKVLKPLLVPLQNRILISSFEFIQLQKFKQYCPDLPVALLVDKKEFKRIGFAGVQQEFNELQAVSLNLPKSLINTRTLAEFRKISPCILVYTVKPCEAEPLLKMGVTGVFTNG